MITKLIYTNVVSQNLVPNPGFEQHSRCPSDNLLFPGDVNFLPLLNWIRPNQLTSDYFHLCNSNLAPNTVYGYQYPRNGEAMVGIICSWGGDSLLGFHLEMLPNGGFVEVESDFREYVEAKLTRRLVKDSIYRVVCWWSRSDDSMAVDNLGIHLSKDIMLNPVSYSFEDQPPQIRNPAGKFMLDNIHWNELKGYYKAEGGESYITLGNMYNRHHTALKRLHKKEILPHLLFAYYFLDDVSVYPGCTTKLDLGSDTLICNGTSYSFDLSTYPGAVSYEWNDKVKTSSRIVDTAGLYSLEIMTDQCFVVDSVRIAFTDCSMENSDLYAGIQIPNVFTPNNDQINDKFEIKGTEKLEISIKVYDRWGVMVYSKDPYDIPWDATKTNDGIYYYILSDKKSKKNIHGYVQIIR